MNDQPRKRAIALAMGDPSGISSELTAKVLAAEGAYPEADILVVGDQRVLEAGARHAGVGLDLPTFRPGDAVPGTRGRAFLDLGNLDPEEVELGRSSQAGGQFALENFRTALRLAAQGLVDAVCFTPFNKNAMRLADPSYVDEIGFVSRTIGAEEGSEFNVLDEIWNARVTSHVPLSAVAALITQDAVFARIVLTDRCMREAGFERPRIAVAALNPHAGDGGNFGHEDEAVIRPAVEAARECQIAVEGPFPSDTVFLRARRGVFDAVLTMYHDQGQIAMKLIGFDRGVTLIGGYSFPVTTPAHGTAYDIAGRGIANDNATRQALALAARVARRHEHTSPLSFAERLGEIGRALH